MKWLGNGTNEKLFCLEKNFTPWNLNYLQAVVLTWQFWILRINDLQKHKVLYTLEIKNNVI